MRLKDCDLTAQDIKCLVEKYMIDTYERFDFVCESAKEMYLYDENGDKYLDFIGGVAVNSAGNCNENVVNAICDQAKDVIHTFNYPYTIPQALLAEKICTTLGYDKIFYQNSGTEANEAMIKMARKYGTETFGPERYHIVTAKNSFHGRTYGSLSATGQPDNFNQAGYKPVLPGFSYADFNDLESFRALVSDNTIAIMIEPIQGEGGVNVATPEFIKGLRQLCDEKGILLLFDEVQTGWCRTGEIMAFMHYGVKPDIISMAKAMGGGMPISAICTDEKLAKTFGLGSHGTTYGGNPVACAAALAQVNELIGNNMAEAAKETGEYLKGKLRELPYIKEVRGKGLLAAAEFEKPIALDIKHYCAEKYLLVTLIGTSIIRVVPPLTVSKEECDIAVEIIKKAAEKYGK